MVDFKPLHNYSYFIYDAIRRIDAGEPLKYALAHTMEHCISHDIMKEFLTEHEQEVVDMYSMNWKERAAREADVEDGIILGRL